MSLGFRTKSRSHAPVSAALFAAAATGVSSGAFAQAATPASPAAKPAFSYTTQIIHRDQPSQALLSAAAKSGARLIGVRNRTCNAGRASAYPCSEFIFEIAEPKE